MCDPGAGTHDLNVARFGAAFVAEVVFVGNRAFTNVSDDFHVPVGVFREAGAGGDHVIVPHSQVAPVHTFWVVVLGERKVMMSIQPAVVGAAQGVERSEFEHDRLLKWVFDGEHHPSGTDR
ncbi:hypothetical protein D9M69_633600 [compost metagenome]